MEQQNNSGNSWRLVIWGIVLALLGVGALAAWQLRAPGGAGDKAAAPRVPGEVPMAPVDAEMLRQDVLALTGLVTATPLLLFSYAARRVTLATVGIVQYIAPTVQFLLGTLVYGETFTRTRLIGFSIVWLALLIYSLEGFIEGRRQRSTALSDS